jgi:phage terminase large subunit-like protein
VSGQVPDVWINPLLVPFLTAPERFLIAYGGRDSGKSWGIATILVIKSFTESNKLIVCLKGTMRSIEDSVKALIENTIVRLGLSQFFKITDKKIICLVTGSKFIFQGLRNPNRIKSVEAADYAWIEEGAVDITEKALEVLIPTIRVKGNKIFISFNPDMAEDPVYKKFIAQNEPSSLVVKINYPQNPFLSPESARYIANMKNTNLAKYNHQFGGELTQEVEGALWSAEIIKHTSMDISYVYDRIVIALDPATTSKSTSDACGIVVAGKIRGKDEYVIIDDQTKICSPNEWATIALMLYDKYEADRIVAETNQGGDMVETIIRNKRKNVSYRGVHAKRGKILRAEPVAALYEEGRVTHSKKFVNMEYEMVTYTGEGDSPNRLDAMVYAVVALSGRGGGLAGMAKVSSTELR